MGLFSKERIKKSLFTCAKSDNEEVVDFTVLKAEDLVAKGKFTEEELKPLVDIIEGKVGEQNGL